MRDASSFNPRLRTGGDAARRWRSTGRCSFNPRLRTGGDSPTRCARRPIGRRFNPRLRTGGDARSCRPYPRTNSCFNPRLRTGGDAVQSLRNAGMDLVSIRASAREATPSAWCRSRPGSCSFNPRLRTGGDSCPAPRRAGSPHRFNPRLRTGGDARGGRFRGPGRVSIRASAREATHAGSGLGER